MLLGRTPRDCRLWCLIEDVVQVGGGISSLEVMRSGLGGLGGASSALAVERESSASSDGLFWTLPACQLNRRSRTGLIPLEKTPPSPLIRACTRCAAVVLIVVLIVRSDRGELGGVREGSEGAWGLWSEARREWKEGSSEARRRGGEEAGKGTEEEEAKLAGRGEVRRAPRGSLRRKAKAA